MLQLVPQAVAQDAGPFTFPGARIEGVGDITQFIVKAAPVQTNNLVEIQANDGSQYITVTGLGETILDVTSTEALLVRKNADGGDVLTVDTTNEFVHISGFLGVGAAALSDRILRTDKVFNSGSAVFGATIQVQNQGNGAVRGASYSAIATSASTPSDVFGVEAVARTLSTSSPTRMAAGVFRGQMDSTGTVSSIRTVWIKAPSKHASATITTLYGLYIDALTQGNTDIAIFTQGGKHVLGDYVTIDQPSATGQQPVLSLDQADFDYVLVKVIATAEAASADRTLVADSDFGTPGALVGWVQIEIQDDGNRITDGDYWVPFYATPTQ